MKHRDILKSAMAAALVGLIRLDRAVGFRSLWIEGYCSKPSVEAGETIDIMVSVKPAGHFRIQMLGLPCSHWVRPHGPDRRVERIAHNALRRAIERRG